MDGRESGDQWWSVKLFERVSTAVQGQKDCLEGGVK